MKLARLLMLVWLVAWLLVPLSAAAEPGLSLLRPDSLIGWEHRAPPHGWRIAKGTLEGDANSTPLLSGWTLGDFTLRLRWSAAERAVVVVNLPDVPKGAGLAVSLTAGDPAVTAIDRGQALLFSAGRIAPGAKAWHIARLARAADKLSIDIDGQPLGDVPLDADRRFGLGLSVRGGEIAVTDIRLTEPTGEPIFNGTDLTGWWSPLGLDSCARPRWSHPVPQPRRQLSAQRKGVRQFHARARI